MKTTDSRKYATPQASVLEIRCASVLLLSGIDSLSIDNSIGSLDEVTFDGLNEDFI
ncbi:MAG: hypothetical protein IKZ71_07740 [Bacteroidales bacterium]|jgi:hypothetical protein|nr:hypothetical protein [Bacteroidales bacterium]